MIAVGVCCAGNPDTAHCAGFVAACVALAVKGEYSSEPGGENDQLEACSAGYSKPVWCDQFPSQAGGVLLPAVIGGCAGAVIVVLVVWLWRRPRSKSSTGELQ
jgi:hypothetical protein